MAIDVPSMSSRNHHTRNGLSSRTIITFSYVFSLFLSLAVLCLMGMSSHVDDSCLAMGGNARWLHLRQDQKRTVPYFSLFFMGKRTHMECQKTKRAETHNRASLTDNPGSFFCQVTTRYRTIRQVFVFLSVFPTRRLLTVRYIWVNKWIYLISVYLANFLISF